MIKKSHNYLLLFVLLFLGFSLILSGTYYYIISKSKLKEAEQNMLAKINVIEEYYDKFEHILDTVSQDPSLYVILKDDFPIEQTQSRIQIQNLVSRFNSLEKLMDIKQITLYVPSSAKYLIDENYFKKITSLPANIPQNKVYNSLSITNSTLLSGRFLFNPKDVFEPLAFCTAEIDLNTIYDSFKKIDGGNDLNLQTQIIKAQTLPSKTRSSKSNVYYFVDQIPNSNVFVMMSFPKKDIVYDILPHLLTLHLLLLGLIILIHKLIQRYRKIAYYELKTLQSQINPHFLYNSLDMINCIAIENNHPEISSMVKSLVAFYRLSLNQGKDVIDFQDEIMHIRHYVDIINLRYANAIDLYIDYDKRLKQIPILKTILQPIVENAIFHGILEKEAPRGILQINAFLVGEHITILIKDNGVGMSPEAVAQCLSFNGKGYGLKNVQHRIKLIYGKNSGITCFSKEGKGTTVIIHL